MYRISYVAWIAASLFLVACGGGGPDDADGSAGSDGGLDGGGSDACMGAADGDACGSGLICLGGACAASVCGDAYVDTAAGEECDDGNDTAFDGCEPSTCTFTCDDDAQCDDRASCNGVETCTDNVCAPGTPPTDGEACTLDGGAAGVCRALECVDPGCGNAVTDGDEECDDGNDVNDDGCDVDCTFSCTENLDCVDGDVCTGDETCDTTTHVCVPGVALDCSDGDDCTTDECDPTTGCFNPLIDADMDGHAPSSLGACGDDCDDTRDDVFTGAEELCDGVDNNCNTDIDETAPTWYIDCDGDGFAEGTGGGRPGCAEPPPQGCGGGWTTVRPTDAMSTDCNDGNADVFPGQTAYFTTPVPGTGGYDYDCNGRDSIRYSCGPSDGTCGSRCSGGYLPKTSSNPNGCEVSCPIGGGFCILRDYPRCGESADYQSCGMIGTVCASTFPSRRTQSCR